MSADEDLKALGAASQARDAERDAWEADESNAPELLAPMTEAERRAMLARVRPAPATPSRGRWWAVSGGLALAAAALLAVFLLPSGPGPLPAYQLEVRSQGYSPIRSATAADPWTYTPGMTLEVVLRPLKAGSAELTAGVFRVEGSAARAIAWAPQVGAGGSLRFRGEIGRALELPAGPSDLYFVVGPEDRVAGWRPGEDTGVQVFRRQITIREEER